MTTSAGGVGERVGSPGLSARITLRRGTLELSVDLEVRPSEVVGLLGPNAAGKTTLLRALAGLTPMATGEVVLDGEVLDDPVAGVHVPAEQRPVGVMFQDYRLFPHLTALENVAFGLRARGVKRAVARRSAQDWLARVGMGDVAGQRPKSLSGGQAQRVALARALVTEPRLLLLDEPLAAIDGAARADLRRDLRRHLSWFEGTALVVTHDPLEAMTLADKLVVLEDGRVTQTGSVEEIGAHPRTRYVADLVGLNLFRGRAEGNTIHLPGGEVLVAADDRYHSGDVFAVVHPRVVALYRELPDGSPRNVWPGTVEVLDVIGDRVRVQVHGPQPLLAEVTPAAVAALGLDDGGDVWAAVKASEVVVYPA